MTYRPRLHQSLEKYIEQIKKLPIHTQQELLGGVHKYTNDRVSQTTKGNTTEVTSNKSFRIKTLEDLIIACEIDLDKYYIERHIINKWEVGSKIDDKVITEPMYQVKAWIKPKADFDFIEQIRKDTINDFKKYSPKYEKRNYPTLSKSDSCLLEINIFDLHFGKLCWGEETGDNYDTKIAEKRFLTALDTLLSRAKGFPIGTIVFPIGNDFFNSDNLRNTTTAGTFQDEDLRWQKTFRKGRELMVKAIDRLSEVAPVQVIVVQGNHDFERSFYLGDAIECWYNNNPNVTIDNNANPRKYVVYGDCLIGFTHGNNEKVANLPLIVAHEQKEYWSKTKYREMHLGHLHHKREIKYISTQEYSGMVVRYMRSLSGTDAWHNQKGYKGSVQSAESFIWHKKDGLISQNYFNL